LKFYPHFFGGQKKKSPSGSAVNASAALFFLFRAVEENGRNFPLSRSGSGGRYNNETVSKKSGGTLFIGLDMAHLATICTFPLRSLLLLAWEGSRAGRGPWGTSTPSIGGRCCGDAFGFFAGEASFAVSFESSQFNGKPGKEDGSARRLVMLMA
jgi:hypothetical protein